jgi:hypothetical protein
VVATVNSKALEVVEMAVTETVAKMKVEALDSPSAILCILRATARRKIHPSPTFAVN